MGLPLTPTAVLDPPTEAGVLTPAVDDGTAELGAAAMLKSELLENTWLILVMLTASKVYWSLQNSSDECHTKDGQDVPSGYYRKIDGELVERGVNVICDGNRLVLGRKR